MNRQKESEHIAEAQAELERWMTMNRAQGASFVEDSPSEPDHVAEARQQAKTYAAARNANKRPLRVPSDESESAREGYESAVSWLERKRRSVVKK